MQRYFTGRDYAFARAIEKLMPGATDGYFERVESRVLGDIRRLQDGFQSNRGSSAASSFSS